jgi:hypothetical protein
MAIDVSSAAPRPTIIFAFIGHIFRRLAPPVALRA